MSRLVSIIVVSYRNSTSNHNNFSPLSKSVGVVSYRNSTSNHNIARTSPLYEKLYLIEILHQTTTCRRCRSDRPCCILSKFYIKPQPRFLQSSTSWVVSYRNSTSNHNNSAVSMTGVSVVSYRNSTSNHNEGTTAIGWAIVVSYRNSTSNHNCDWSANLLVVLYLIEILHQTTTHRGQHRRHGQLYLIEILHQTTTVRARELFAVGLYLIEILHQTTTRWLGLYSKEELYLIEILHQTTTLGVSFRSTWGCILSKFYIKPQPRVPRLIVSTVVSYRNSTSNHNGCFFDLLCHSVVSYRNSTSNHNYRRRKVFQRNVVSYRNSTSNHNLIFDMDDVETVVSYRNSTSNHNCLLALSAAL